MYCISEVFPAGAEKNILRIGTVDDFSLHEMKLRPQRETYTKDSVDWLCTVEGIQQRQAEGL
jgi:hypothetical protein